MTIFGPDISSYEHGLNIAALPDPFVIAKVTEGTYYRDADWPAFRDAARRAGKILVGYHFVTGEDPRAQAANLAGWIGDRSIPVMLDFEPTGNSHPTHAQQLAVADAVNAAGMHVRLSYTPRWYWQQIGSPNLTGLTTRGIGVVSSAYPNTSITDPPRDYAADGGDTGPGWAPYGGITPLLWQFTDAGVEQQRMDFNAFRGTIAELAVTLRPPGLTPAPSPTPLSDPEDDMPAFATGEIKPGAGVTTVVLPPPANAGAARWGNVWFSLGSDFGDAHVRITLFRNGAWTEFHEDFVVRAADGRVQPFEVPLSTDVEKISITRLAGSENVPLSYLIEATHR